MEAKAKFNEVLAKTIDRINSQGKEKVEEKPPRVPKYASTSWTIN